MNKPRTSPASGGPRDESLESARDDSRSKRTPSTDMQADDAGTADSGADSNPTDGAMKQTSKTPTERGSR